MGTEIDDLYVLLRATTAPMLDGFLEAGTAGEEMAAKIAGSVREIEASVDQMAENVRVAGGMMAESWTADRYEIDRLAKATQEASLKMEAATARAATANEALSASMAGPTVESRLKASAGGFAMLGLAVGAAAGMAVHMAADFESSTQKLVSTAGESAQGLDVVRKGMLAMAGDVGYTDMQLSDGMYKVESAGFHAGAGLTVLRASAEGAKAEQADLVTVSDAVTSALRDYNLGAGDAAMVTSKLVAATGAGKMTFQEMAGSLSQILPIAAVAHISLNDILGDLASMTVHGMSARQAAQNLGDTIRHLIRFTDQQKTEFALLGTNAAEVSAALDKRGLAGTLEFLTDRINNFVIPGGKSKQVVMDLGNALRGLNPQVQELGGRLLDGSTTMKEYTKAAHDLDPISSKQAMQFATIAGQTHKIGDRMVDGATVAQSYGEALYKATGDATALRTTLMLTGDNMNTTKNAINAVSGATTEAGGHVMHWHEVQKTFNQKWSEFKAGLGAVATEIGTKLLPVAGLFLGWLMDSAKWLSHHHTVMVLLASVIGGALVVGLYMAAAAAWAFTTALLFNPIILIILAIGLFIFELYELITHWRQIVKWLRTESADFWHWLGNLWHEIAKGTSDAWHNWIVKPIKEAWDKAGKWIDDAVDFFKKLPGRIGDALKALPGIVLHSQEKMLRDLAYAVGFGIGKVYLFFKEAPGKVAMWVKEMWDKVVDKTSDGLAAVIVWVYKLPDRLHDMWEKAKDKTIDGIIAVLLWVSQLPGKVEHWFIQTRDKAVAAAADLVDSVVNWVKSLPGKTHTELMNFYHTVVNFFSGARDWLWNAGNDLINGLVNGVRSAWNWAVGQVKDLGHEIVRGFKDAVGIHSPSRLFHEAGEYIVQGLADGITATLGRARSAVGELAAMMAAPAIAITGTLAVAAGANAMPGTGAILGPRPGGMPSAPVAAPAGAATQQVQLTNEVHLYVDGDEIRNLTIRDAQRNKLRNGTSLLT